MKKILSVFLLCFGLVGFVSAGEAPQPCGPAGDLSDELSTNVDSNARCFELRMYTAEPVAADGSGGIDNLHQRFREEEVAIFEKHGAEIIAVWQRLDNPNTLVWMLAYRDRAHRQEVWAAFAADPAWEALLAKYPVPISIEAFMMSTTDYSNLK
ncbi:MAG: hypothetical protein GKR91_08660 [Pseudomonadales bacterium]|nr:hypothetical protein [Pseudomonadales bacterium]